MKNTFHFSSVVFYIFISKRNEILSLFAVEKIEKINFMKFHKVYFLKKRKKNFYPTAIIRAKKNDHVVAIPPKR